MNSFSQDEFRSKGAIEQEAAGEPELCSLYLRDEPESEEEDPEGAQQDQDPGHRQKQNQDEEEDPLAA